MADEGSPKPAAEEKPKEPEIPCVEIKVDAGKEIGVVRRINGGNGGPICYGGLVDVTKHHRSMRMPINRTHDANWPGGKEVDVHTIFPDFNADPELPSSYFFAPTDDYVLSLVGAGQEVMFRLGESIEHTARKYWAHKPADYGKWARICVGIVRHYNEGWADGFRLGIRYWEIWNEPDLGSPMWDGTIKEYIEMYAVAARAIKERFPDVKVGGPGAVGIGAPQAPGALHKPVEMLLDRCKRDGIPLDFVSWHCYTVIPSLQVDVARGMRKLLDEKYGMRETELHLDEWNYVPEGFGPVLSKGGEAFERFVEEVGSAASAAFATCFLLAMQDSPVDMTYFYSTDCGCFGMFSPFGVPKKTYYAFVAFRELADHPRRVDLTGSIGGELEAVAGLGEDGESLCLLIGAFHQPNPPVPILIKNRISRTVVEIENIPWEGDSAVEVRVIDGKRNLEVVLEETFEEGEVVLEMDLPPPTVALVTVKKPKESGKKHPKRSFGNPKGPKRCEKCGRSETEDGQAKPWWKRFLPDNP